MITSKPLGEVGVSVHDCEHKTPAAQNSGHPYVAIPDIIDGRIDISTTRKISDEDLQIWTRRTTPQVGDIVVTRRGRVGDTAPIPQENCAIGQNLVLLRSDETQVLQEYLRWATRSPSWYDEVDRYLNVGAVFSSLNVRDIPKLSIPVPSLSIQRAIAEVLGALDDKIAANKAVVELCDQLRHTYWKQLTTKATTEQPLSELAQFVNGRAFTKNADGKGRMVVRIAELNTGPGASTVYSSIDVPENHTVSAGELLMSWSGSLRTARWFRDDAIVNQHIFKVIPTAPDTEWAVESAIDTLMPTFRSIAADKATTMGHIKREHLDFKVRWPRLTDGQQALGASVWRRALQAEIENEVLARTRDELLPLLMNGTITVREAEDRTKEVL